MTDSSAETPNSFADPVSAIAASEQARRLSLWMLRMDAENPALRLVHGSVLPSRVVEPEAIWSTFEVRRFSKKVRLVRFAVDLPGSTCSSILRSIAGGSAVYSALEEQGVGLEALKDSSLGSLPLTRLPNAYFSGSAQLHGLPRHLAARRSPVNGVGCYCARFAPPDRFSFLPAAPEDSESLVRRLGDEMKTETALDFGGSAGDAFGCLEVYHFPSLDQSERPRVSIEYAKAPSRAVKIRIESDAEDARYAVQVRSEQVRDIAADELHLLDPNTQEVMLELPEPLDGATIRIWRRLGASDSWLLWHEQEDHFLRAIGTRMQLGGLTGSVGAPWLERLPARLSSRVERFKQIRQVSMESPMEISSREGWETGIQSARKLAGSTSDAKSTSRFFQRGWGSDENKFEFAEWLKGELSGHSGRIVVVDPYFDLLGLDLICRASGAANELTVLTCTQVPSEDDEPSVTRADRLLRAAKDIFSVIRGLSLRICDLKSAKSRQTSKQLFHDRYLLFLDAAGNAQKGYSLSTSLQSAATTSPILITEIPSSTLDQVADYVVGLLTPGTDHVLETIFPIGGSSRKTRAHGMTEARAETVLAALKVAGRETGGATPIERLEHLGVYRDSKVSCEFSDDELAKLVSYLCASELAVAADCWEGMVETGKSAWHEGIPSLVSRLQDKDQGGELAEFLHRYLTAQGLGELTSKDSFEHTRTLAVALELQFERAIGEAARFYDHHHDFPLGTTWAIRFALIYLGSLGPEGVDALLAELRAKKTDAEKIFDRIGGPKALRPGKDDTKRAGRVLANVDALFSAVVSTLTWFVQPLGPGLPAAYGSSREPFARALWAIALVRQVVAETPSLEPAVLLEKLTALPDVERRLTLAQIVFELRIRANQAQARSASAEPLPAWLLDAVVECAATPTTAEELVGTRCTSPVLSRVIALT